MRHLAAPIVAALLVFAGWQAKAADLALVGAKIYPSPEAAPILDGAVVIHDGRILTVGPRGRVRLPRGATVLDVHGAVVTAGFWNSHVHILTDAPLGAATLLAAKLSMDMEQLATHWGFTTVFDTASMLGNTETVRRRIASGEIKGPAILTVGDPFYPKGGTPIYVKGFFADNQLPSAEITSVPEAVARARRQIAAGADGVKLFTGAIVGGTVGVLPMPLDQATAIAAEAHRDGKPVFAHPSNVEGLTVAMDAGVDILAHTTPMSGPWPPQLVARIKAHHMALVPTLTLFEVEAKKFGESDADSKNDMDAAVQQVRVYSQAGGQILFGTDVGYTDAFDTTEEYRQMGRALDWRQILASLTVNPASRFHQSARKGRVAKGLEGDLVVLDADPAADVTAFAKVRYTIRHGVVIYARDGARP
jgi:imidazolonepropionase-like amidohydrolase